MKESSWQECTENNSAVEKSRDKRRAESLRDTALGRIIFIEKLEIKEENANYIFENYYSSIAELIHALCALRGYKVLNHVCLGLFLKEILNREDLFRIFDDLRFKRNSLLYYGEKMDFAVSKDAVGKSKRLVKELRSELEGERQA